MRRRGPLRLRIERLGGLITDPPRRLARERRRRRRARRGMEKPPSWRLRRFARFIEQVSYAGAFLFLLWVARAVYVAVIRGEPWGWLVNPDRGCGDTGFSCGVVSGSITTVLTLSFATALFLFLRFR